MLSRVDGPECPRCGCQQGETLASWERVHHERQGGQFVETYRETVLRRQCAHCGKVFAAVARPTNGQHPRAPIVPFFKVLCPVCGSDDNLVTHTRAAGLRYHKCNACDATFKSRETKITPKNL